MELLRITRQIHCKVVEQRATLNTDNTSGQWSLRWRKWTPAAVCDMPSCPAVLATLRLSRKPKHQLPQQLPVSACLLFQFLIKMRCSLYWYAVRCPPPYRGERRDPYLTSPLLQNPGGATGFTSSAGWLPRTGISSGTLRSVIAYGLNLPFYASGTCSLAVMNSKDDLLWTKMTFSDFASRPSLAIF